MSGTTEGEGPGDAAATLSGADPAMLVPDPDALALLDASTARRHDVLPLGFDPDTRTLALATPAPADVLRRDAVRAHVDPSVRLRWHAADARFVAGALERLRIRGVPGGNGGGEAVSGDDVSAPVDALLHAAVVAGASDLHLTPGARLTHVRHRVDGVLGDVAAVPASRHAAFAVRLKVMAGLDIAECRVPQDGAFERLVRARRIDFRLSSFPTIDGERLVLRVLDPASRPLDLEALGIDAGTCAALTALVARPGGLLVVAGPTGSGKSTTLHALLRTLVGQGVAIVTLEDPVEHRVEGVSQSSIDPARGLDHAAGVRALLRQDPDVLMIGEIRDAVSCRMALRAAGAGHRVLATVHATDAIGALERLVELGDGAGDDADDAHRVRAALARVLTGVAAQRLVGRLCGCSYGPGGTGTISGDRSGSRCTRCRGRGLAGRFALLELLRVTPEVGAALLDAVPASALAACAEATGFVPLATLARDAVARGGTTRAEVVRTLGIAALPGSVS